jgi:hypothetical protein
MELLNELYNKSCKPECKSYEQISKHIILIDNFFQNFDNARDFFINREKWRCTRYQGHDKPGYESLFPNWIGKSLMEKFILDNNLLVDINSYNVTCNFFYNNLDYIWSISNSGHFPHIDGIRKNNIQTQICLINLNKVPISTKFYMYKNKEYCSSELRDEWNEYTENMQNKLIQHYNTTNITENEVKLFLNNQKLDIEVIKTLEYKPNQSIIYPSDLFHSSNAIDDFTEDNPRSVLRIAFNKKDKS